MWAVMRKALGASVVLVLPPEGEDYDSVGTDPIAFRIALKRTPLLLDFTMSGFAECGKICETS